jgi:hypothetical protein
MNNSGWLTSKPEVAFSRFQDSDDVVLSAVSEAPPSEELGVETLWEGRFRYSGLKEAAPGDYGICFSMRRSLSFAV